MKFTKKPTAVEAIQWISGNVDEIMNFMEDAPPVFDYWNRIVI